MNLINDFDMERISQAIEDIGSLCIADIFSPGKLWYAPVKMVGKQLRNLIRSDQWIDGADMMNMGGSVVFLQYQRKLTEKNYGWRFLRTNENGMPRILSFFYTVMKNQCRGWICITKVVF